MKDARDLFTNEEWQRWFLEYVREELARKGKGKGKGTDGPGDSPTKATNTKGDGKGEAKGSTGGKGKGSELPPPPPPVPPALKARALMAKATAWTRPEKLSIVVFLEFRNLVSEYYGSFRIQLWSFRKLSFFSE